MFFKSFSNSIISFNNLLRTVLNHKVNYFVLQNTKALVQISSQEAADGKRVANCAKDYERLVLKK